MKVEFLVILSLFHGSSALNNKIINGQLARDSQFPHMTQISIKTKNSDANQYCGGSLLDHQWILTAAHCFREMISAKAYMGSVFWRSMPIRMKIVEVVIHPDFINVNAHDVALARLESTVKFTENVQPIQLPSKTEGFFNSTLFVAGFGDTKNSSQSMLYLRYVKMREISNEECSEQWGWKIDESKLCTVGLEDFHHTTCRGDSGNGIVTKDEKDATILGIISYGAPGCLGKPKVLTRVSKYLDFIHTVTKIDIEK